jgi:hydrogenase maturation factor
MQSCVKEALQLAETGGVHAMHDTTEGGLVSALNEMAEASRVGFNVEIEDIPIIPEARMLQESFALSDEQLLSTSSTGTIIAAVDTEAKDKIEETMRRNGVSANLVGTFTKNKDRNLVKDNKRTPFPQVADDPYNTIFFSKI